MTKKETIKLKSHGPADLTGYTISIWAKEILPQITFTTGIEYEVVIINGEEFSDDERTTENIRARAKELGYEIPPAEVALLLLERPGSFQWVVVMHEPIKNSDGGSSLLGAGRFGGDRWLYADWDGPGGRWPREGGFAFLVSRKDFLTLERAIKICKENNYQVAKIQ